MQQDIAEKIEELKGAGIAKLSTLYRELFGAKAPPGNRVHMIRQLAYQIQERTRGGISGAAKDSIREMIQTYDPINKTSIKTNSGKTEAGRDARLPMPGSFIIKTYKGNRIEVKVLENGFEYQGALYKNLSAVAEAITGNHWNGFIFFGVGQHARK